MSRINSLILLAVILAGSLTACSPVAQPTATYDPATLRFSGERALAIETEFVTQFPLRHSGQPNNRLAAEWLFAEFTRLGWACRFDEWDIINYSRPLNLRNVVCQLPGVSAKEILVLAHHDQSPDTIQGADNDGSGISILLQLAEIFAAESQRPYTLIFVAADAEEYGMLGSRRYIQTHPDTRQIIAGVSLDNLGKEIFTGLDMDPRGQFRNYGALWLQLTAQAAARAMFGFPTFMRRWIKCWGRPCRCRLWMKARWWPQVCPRLALPGMSPRKRVNCIGILTMPPATPWNISRPTPCANRAAPPKRCSANS
jgi:hypothetical protein